MVCLSLSLILSLALFFSHKTTTAALFCTRRHVLPSAEAHAKPPPPPPRTTMKPLTICRLSRVGDSSSSSSTPHRRVVYPRSGVPQGHIPVYVGEEMERFVVSVHLLSRPAFAELLRRSAQVYGYEQRGVLRIPCTVDLFRRVLHLLRRGRPDDFAAALEVARSTPDNAAVVHVG